MSKWKIEGVPPVIDFEASSLSMTSYPISAGIAHNGKVFYWIIRPEPEWIDWSLDSQNIHGLSRAFINKHGLPASKVLDEIKEVLAGEKYVYSDNPSADQFWLNRLGSVDIEVAHIKSLIDSLSQGIFQNCHRNEFIKHGLVRHRADHDALCLALTLKTLLK